MTGDARERLIGGLSIFEASPRQLDAGDWCEAFRKTVLRRWHERGAVLLRDFDVSRPDTFRRVIEATSSVWAEYREAATPRRAVSEHIFTSTEYPATETIRLHNENSHCTSWPLKIYFFCEQAADRGGQTPIVDCRRVLDAIPPDIVDEFTARRWMYTRRFGGPLGFGWQKVFKTSSRSEVERYCAENEMSYEWSGSSTLTVRYVREAVHRHPMTSELVWFNHGLFFNKIAMNSEWRRVLSDFTDDELPYNTRFGDGGEVPIAILEAIERAYQRHTFEFDWQTGDLLMLDNMLFAHGRRPFSGPRRVLVGMGEPCRHDVTRVTREEARHARFCRGTAHEGGTI